MTEKNWLDAIRWDAEGLLPVIVQEGKTGRVLMMAWTDREALALTVETGLAHYWSRSRKQLWKKGEQSGHFQYVKSLRLDCDSDVLLMQIEQQNGIACHTGRESCFYRQLENNIWETVDPVLKDPAKIYIQT